MGIRNTLFKIIGLLQYLAIKGFLQFKGYSNVSPFLFKSWHHGVSYFSAIQKGNNQKVFIKTSGTYNAAKVEFYCLTSINAFQKKLVPQAFKLYDWRIFSFVIMEMIEGTPLTSINTKEEQFITYSQNIISALNYTDIVHRDISPDNIMVTSTGNIFLIDFAWAITPRYNKTDIKHIENLKALGGRFKPDILTWQDSFSLQSTYYQIFHKNFKPNEETKKIIY